MVIRTLVFLLLVTSVLVGASAPAHACDCASMSPAEAVADADTVFTGTVTEATGERHSTAPFVYTFRADTVYKGTPAAAYTLASSGDGASCGYLFAEGGRYLVFASTGGSGLLHEVEGVSMTSTLCSGNVPVKAGTEPLRPGDERRAGHESWGPPIDAKMIAALGTPSKPGAAAGSPAPAPGTGIGWGWIASGALLALLVVVLLARLRGRGE